MEFAPVYLIFIPIIFSMIIYLFNNRYSNLTVYIAQVSITVLSLRYYIQNNGLVEPRSISLGNWNKIIGISLKIDNLSIAFVFLTIFIWWIVLIYCWDKKKEDSRFLFFLMFLEGTFLGLLQTNDMFNLFIFVEITTIISTILIIYKKDGYSVKSGFYYLMFNSVGMIFYLIGLILIYNLSGTLNMDIIAIKIYALKDIYPVKLAYILMMAAIGVKSAFFPVYNWLPKAHSAAPSSISALLSGLLVKSGLYIFIRLNDIFYFINYNEFFFVLGSITAISGIIFALSQKDIKQILAFHTISQIGIILMGLSMIGDKAYVGGLLHIFNHAMFKSLLFMGVGVVISTYGIRRITEIRGVFNILPYTSIFMIIGMLSITGSPFFNGFISKTVIKYGVQESNIKSIILYIINLGTSISFIKLSQIFFGKSNIKRKKSINLNLSMFIVAVACIIFGNYYTQIGKLLFGADISYIHVLKLDNWINYLSTLFIGYIIYKYYISKDSDLLKRIRHTNVSFQTTNYLLIIFIFIMLIWNGK